VPLATTRGALQQARRLLQRTLESPLPDNASDLLTKLQEILVRAERQISAEIRLTGNLLMPRESKQTYLNSLQYGAIWLKLCEKPSQTSRNSLLRGSLSWNCLLMTLL